MDEASPFARITTDYGQSVCWVSSIPIGRNRSDRWVCFSLSAKTLVASDQVHSSTMSSEAPGIFELARWYRKKVRPFLQAEESGRIVELDRDLERLEAREKILDRPMSACFVGGAGIGKSTLINALVAGGEVVVPSGGVGPLTAQALQIAHSTNPSFSAIYHPAARVWALGFALEGVLRRNGMKSNAVTDENDLSSGLDAEVADDAKQLQSSSDGDGKSKIEYLRKQAQLMLMGSQNHDSELTYLVDGIREITGNRRVWGTTLRNEDKIRVGRLREILDTKHTESESIHEVDGTSPSFRRDLHDHAAGFLSPIIKELEVGWNSSLLESNLELIDLPGLGVAGDVYRKVTEKWVRNDAHAVVLVVTHRGVLEADASLLRSSGFLTRLLHSIDDPSADPVSLIVAVVKTDEIANDRWQQDRSKRKSEHLADVMSECRGIVKNQIRDRLIEAWSLEGEDIGQGKVETIERILNGMQIFPVSAMEYRRFVVGDDDDRSFLIQAEQSGVPSLASGLESLAHRHSKLKHDRFSDALNSFHDRLTGILTVIKARWEERVRAKEEAEALQQELAFFLQPLRERFRARQGAYRNFLKETLPQSIELVISNASNTATKAIKAYLRGLKDAHWKTLQAAVTKEGTFHGSRHINLPADFADTFEDPIAEGWSKEILKELRKQTKNFSDDCLAFVDEIVEWARAQGGRVQPRLIEVQREAIAADTKHLATVGKDAVDELRDRVKSSLSSAIEGPIRRRCKAFVARNEHVGTGVKNRILELFNQLAEEAVEAAKVPASKVLQDNYQIVEREIVEAWKSHQDPLGAAGSAIVASHEDSVRRSDAQKRKAIIETVDSILLDRPQSLAT